MYGWQRASVDFTQRKGRHAARGLTPSRESAPGARILALGITEGVEAMPRGKRAAAEQIIAKLREAEVELARGRKVPEAAKKIGVTSKNS